MIKDYYLIGVGFEIIMLKTATIQSMMIIQKLNIYNLAPFVYFQYFIKNLARIYLFYS